MAYEQAFEDYDAEAQAQICQDLAGRWRRAGRLVERRGVALTEAEVAAIDAALAGLRAEIVPDTLTLLPEA